QLKRALGGVKRAVFALYGISVLFAVVGVSLAALTMVEGLRLRVVYVVAMVLFSFIGVIALKAARRKQLDAEAGGVDEEPGQEPALAAASAKPAPAKAVAARTAVPAPTSALPKQV